MNRFIQSIFLLISLAFICVSADSDIENFIIPTLHTSGRFFTEKISSIIKAEDDSILPEVDFNQSLKPGQIIMRKKYEPGEYRLYKGNLDTAAFGRKQSLYAFKFPVWARFSQILKYRFYTSPSDNPNLDEEEVYFDNERIYMKNYKKLFYFHEGTWIPIQGSNEIPLGGLKISSEPSGAEIVINGVRTKCRTPGFFPKIFAGTHIVELFLPDHQFGRRSIQVFSDSITTASFELFSDFDTIYITGHVDYGLLLLPQPPLENPFVIDSQTTDSLRLRLSPGKHHIFWNGGDKYETLDTVVNIIERKVNYIDYIFRQRYGIVRVRPRPADAEVCLGLEKCDLGERIIELPTGTYQLSANHYGFESLKKLIKVKPDTITTVDMDLTQKSDRDGDGFIDSLDKCPEVYGLYDGCPKRRILDALESKKEDIADFVAHDHLAFDILAAGLMLRIPTKKYFANFLSTFSSGKIGGVNNYRGLTILNSFQVEFKGLYGSFELGQWTAGLHYQRSDTMLLHAKKSDYLIYYDSLGGIEPAIFIPSTSVALGVHYNWSWVNVVYAIGYQWEDIIIDQIYNSSDQTFKRVCFNNDWWYHQINCEINFRTGRYITPSVYFKAKFPFGPIMRTRWQVFQTGLQMKVTPYFRGKQ